MDFMKRCEVILDSENVKYNKKVVASLIQKFFPDWRRVLNELQRYSASGEIDAGILVNLSEDSVKELLSFLKNKEFTNVRRWIVNLDSRTIPNAVLVLADYSYKSAFVSDQEINLLACMTELMQNCEFK